jgi:hypothetical protein
MSACAGFIALTNGGDFVGTHCCVCGEKESAHVDRVPLEWSALWSAMRPEPHPWVLTTEHMFDEMLGALPPIDMGGGAFLVGEPNHHNADGEAVYACFHRYNGIVEARYLTVAEFRVFKSIHSAQCA